MRRAEDIGMVVNTQKTAMLCISDALPFEADSYITDADQNRIGCQEKMKALGMTFSNRLNMSAQVAQIKKTIPRTLLGLTELKE